MIELMVIIEMFKIDSGEDCRRGVKDKEEKKIYLCLFFCDCFSNCIVCCC